MFFLPGDSLLFVTGLFISTGAIGVPLWLACILLSLAAWAGNLSGYAIGRKVGPALFHRPDSKLLNPEGIAKTHAFFEKYGPKAIVLGRFVPIVRTFITAMAGVGRMDARVYGTYSLIGGVLWAAGLTILGYFLGQNEFVQKNIEIIAVLIVRGLGAACGRGVVALARRAQGPRGVLIQDRVVRRRLRRDAASTAGPRSGASARSETTACTCSSVGGVWRSA